MRSIKRFGRCFGSMMLYLEPNRCYYVYPSWAQLKWEDLGRHLAEPLKSPYIRDDPNKCGFDWEGHRRSLSIQPFHLIDGPAGAGIICAHVKRGELWLPDVILGSEANVCSPPGMDVFLMSNNFDPRVYYLEPFDQSGWELNLGKKTRLYLCSASPEHVEGDPGEVFWLIGYKKAKGEIRGLQQVSTWARQFRLDIKRLPSVPNALRSEVAPWFINPVYEYVWFHVTGGGEGVGLHFAVLIYLAFHLRKVAGPRMDCMHLVSDIEGKPNVRVKYWPRR